MFDSREARGVIVSVIAAVINTAVFQETAGHLEWQVTLE